jgi:DNA excision repair protein ERCC-3
MPLIIESDRAVCVEVDHPRYEEVREQLCRFAELEKSPGKLHTYRISAISIWNAAALGARVEDILKFLEDNSRYPLPAAVRDRITTWHRRYGSLTLEKIIRGPGAGMLALVARDEGVFGEAMKLKEIHAFVGGPLGASGARHGFIVDPAHRGALKQFLTEHEFPVEDVAGYVDGAPLELSFRTTTRAGRPFALRKYQIDAIDAFHAGGSSKGGSGVVVLPCGAGKTVVGMAAMERLHTCTLVLTTSAAAVHQWRDEILDKTTLGPGDVGEYTGAKKDLKPVTVTTYQMLTYRRSKTGPFKHFNIFEERDWGLVIYDEVHLLPAPVFSLTAGLQARRRLGLTATLVREDGKESNVFSLIGPKRYEAPWRALERQGYIAAAHCKEVRVPMPAATEREYAASPRREQFRVASENPAKLQVISHLLGRHAGDHVLILGQFLDQLHLLSRELAAPLITGATPNDERERLYVDFRAGRVPVLIVSKVGNFAIDLPDANVAIQVSGTFGSRQEEAQRLGRVLRPKADGRPALFYAIVTADSRDREFAEKRERFLTEQGYTYEIVESEKLLSENTFGMHGTSSKKGVVA